jgi:hypothetical protein
MIIEKNNRSIVAGEKNSIISNNLWNNTNVKMNSG